MMRKVMSPDFHVTTGKGAPLAESDRSMETSAQVMSLFSMMRNGSSENLASSTSTIPSSLMRPLRRPSGVPIGVQ